MPTPTIPSAGIRPLLLAVFLDMMAFAVILPGLPFYALELGAGGLGLGILLSAYSLAKLVGAAAGGRLSDWHGRRPVLLVCLAGSGVSFLLTGMADSLLALALARAVAGLFGGTVGIAQAAIADLTGPADRARHMGLLGAAIGSGFVVGPTIGAMLARHGFLLLALVAAGVAFANAALAWRTLPVVAPREAERRTPEGSLRTELNRPGVRLVLAAMFLTLFTFVSMETTLALLAHDRYGLLERGFGMVLAFVGLIMIVVQGGVVGRLVRSAGEKATAALGALLLGASMVALPAAVALPTGLAILAILAVGQGLASPSLAALLSRIAGGDARGGMMGLGQSLSAAGRALAPLIAGWLYDRGEAWPFLLGGMLSLVAAGCVTAARPQSTPAAG